MTSVSPLKNVLKKGLHGDYEGKNEDKLIKIKEINNLLITQIAQYKNSSSQIKDTSVDGLSLPHESLKVNSNDDSRILWCGPKNWLLVSKKKIYYQLFKKHLTKMTLRLQIYLTREPLLN